MQSRRNPIIASEGIPYMLATLAATGAVWQFFGLLFAVIPAALLVYLYLLFRDPERPVPAAPLGVVSPVDGNIVAIGLTDSSVLGGEAQKVIIRVDSFGTYTARCPIEGKVLDLKSDAGRAPVSSGGLWVRTDEDDDVVLQFSGHRFGLAPRAFMRYGERVGQGQRCAFLRLTGIAEVQLPLNARVLVEAGQRVAAGSDLLARLPHH